MPSALSSSLPLAQRIKQSNDELTLSDSERNGRKTLTTVQGLPKKFDQKKILKVIKKKFGKPQGCFHPRQYDKGKC